MILFVQRIDLGDIGYWVMRPKLDFLMNFPRKLSMNTRYRWSISVAVFYTDVLAWIGACHQNISSLCANLNRASYVYKKSLTLDLTIDILIR